MTLYEMTQRESGIVLYDNEAIVVNWSSYDDDMLPRLDPTGLSVISFPDRDGLLEEVSKTERSASDIKEELPRELEVLSDEYNDILAMLDPESPRHSEFEGMMGCRVWEFNDDGIDVKIISPDAFQ